MGRKEMMEASMLSGITAKVECQLPALCGSFLIDHFLIRADLVGGPGEVATFWFAASLWQRWRPLWCLHSVMWFGEVPESSA